MNIIFMGTPTFALPVLRSLAEEHTVCAVFTKRDAPSHRGKTPLPSLVKALALKLGIPTYTPRSFYKYKEDNTLELDERGLRVLDEEILSTIRSYEPDLIVVAAYGIILPQEVLDIPRHGSIGIHGSLLPRWRGAAPIQRALMAGDERVGISIMQMERGLDTGPYGLQDSTSAAGKSYQQLIVELGEMGARLLMANLDAIESGDIEWIQQDESLVTYAEKVMKGSVDLDAELTVAENLGRVLASTHHARCRSEFHGRHVMIIEARPTTTLSSKGLFFACSDGSIEITKLKPDGKREMTGSAFLAGLR